MRAVAILCVLCFASVSQMIKPRRTFLLPLSSAFSLAPPPAAISIRRQQQLLGSRSRLTSLKDRAPLNHFPLRSLDSHPSLGMSAGDEDNENGDDSSSSLAQIADSDQLVLGTVGTLMPMVVFVSEFTLKTTGCGLPAGPLGIYGLVEGLSYLGVVGIVSLSVVTKIKTGAGLPAGPYGLLGAAEGLSFLAILPGLVVLILQVTNYGYIPNAIPYEAEFAVETEEGSIDQ